jgi:hypothetical protein
MKLKVINPGFLFLSLSLSFFVCLFHSAIHLLGLRILSLDMEESIFFFIIEKIFYDSNRKLLQIFKDQYFMLNMN